MHQVKTMGLTLTFHMYSMYLATSFNENISKYWATFREMLQHTHSQRSMYYSVMPMLIVRGPIKQLTKVKMSSNAT